MPLLLVIIVSLSHHKNGLGDDEEGLLSAGVYVNRYAKASPSLGGKLKGRVPNPTRRVALNRTHYLL